MMWRKSSHSGPDGNCLEVRGDLAALRDSKAPGVIMPVGRTAMSHFVASVRTR
jgi:hypothetical protein